MSFILDALKKSENERQDQAPAEFVTVPSDPDTPRAPKWLWVLGALLVVNIIVVIVLITNDEVPTVSANLRENTVAATPSERASGDTGARPVPREATDTAEAPPAAGNFADQLEEARRNLPERVAADLPADTMTAIRAGSPANRPARASIPPSSSASSLALLPSLDELRLNGEVSLPAMHVDIHVYSENPRDRFVFINMDKYREHDTMTAGPVVREITREGVVLDFRGRRFILPRE